MQEVFERWLQQVKDDLDGMHGWQSARLLESDAAAGGHLKVFFSSRLTDVVTQVRDVAALGFKIPSKVAQEVKVSQRQHRTLLITTAAHLQHALAGFDSALHVDISKALRTPPNP